MRKASRTLRGTVAVALLVFAVAVARTAGLCWNSTGSAPAGLWRVTGTAWQRGDMVLIDVPPDRPLFRAARGRGYLRPGWTRSGCAPLLKRVIAIAGDRVDVAESIRVNGRLVPGSLVRANDSRGRPLWREASSERVAPGMVWLISETPQFGFDSRYFGALPAKLVRGRAQPLVTW